ncbi:MAG TPA: hypothetical protein VF438_01080 [Candidatus Paceibacterota bacterium]
MSSSLPNAPTPPVSDEVISRALRALATALDDGAVDPPEFHSLLIPTGYDLATFYAALRNKKQHTWSQFMALAYAVIDDRPSVDIAALTDLSAYFTHSGTD